MIYSFSDHVTELRLTKSRISEMESYCETRRAEVSLPIRGVYINSHQVIQGCMQGLSQNYDFFSKIRVTEHFRELFAKERSCPSRAKILQM